MSSGIHCNLTASLSPLSKSLAICQDCSRQSDERLKSAHHAGLVVPLVYFVCRKACSLTICSVYYTFFFGDIRDG
jgi:hypothetical protein